MCSSPQQPRRRTDAGELPACGSSTAAAPDTTLEYLLAAVATGDRRAFRRAYELTSRHLLGVAIRILRDREIAEDVLQDAFVRVWERAGTFDASTAKPMTWLISIVRNRAIDVLRAGRLESTISLPLDEETLQIAADPSWRPDTSFETRQVESSLLRGLAALNPSQRQALALTYYRGMTHKEVATGDGCPARHREGLGAARTRRAAHPRGTGRRLTLHASLNGTRPACRT